MGMVTVSMRGSFSKMVNVEYCAEEGGHAFAISRAVADLLSVMPEAIQLDHELSRGGDKPPRSDFGKKIS